MTPVQSFLLDDNHDCWLVDIECTKSSRPIWVGVSIYCDFMDAALQYTIMFDVQSFLSENGFRFNGDEYEVHIKRTWGSGREAERGLLDFRNLELAIVVAVLLESGRVGPIHDYDGYYPIFYGGFKDGRISIFGESNDPYAWMLASNVDDTPLPAIFEATDFHQWLYVPRMNHKAELKGYEKTMGVTSLGDIVRTMFHTDIFN